MSQFFTSGGKSIGVSAKVMFGKDGIISTADSKVKVVVLPTDEELMIAQDTLALINLTFLISCWVMVEPPPGAPVTK